jgi:S1-C subfamily serine protease
MPAWIGLRPGEIIVGVNNRKVTDIESFEAALRLNRSSILLHVNRNSRSLYIVIR